MRYCCCLWLLTVCPIIKMKRSTENQGDTRSLKEYFSPGSKVKDLPLQQCSLPHFASFLQETPMKPSQVPNKFPHPLPRRMLPLQSPELCHRDRMGPPRHPHQLGPILSSRFVPSGPSIIGSPANRPHFTPRDRVGPLHSSAQPSGSSFSQPVPVSPTNGGTTANKPQPLPPGTFHSTSSQFMKDLSNHSPPSHIRRDQVTESKITMSYSGCENVTARQEANKAQSSDVWSCVHTVQLHRPPLTPSLNTRSAQEASPLPQLDSEYGSQWPIRGYQPSHSTNPPDKGSDSSLPIMHSSVAPCQDQQPQQTPSSEKLTPEVELNHSSQKRRRESEDSDDGAKKLCFQTPKPTVVNSFSNSLVPQPSPCRSSVSELSPQTTDLCPEPASGQSTDLELSSAFKGTQSSCASLSPNRCIKRQPSMGAKQVYIKSSHNHAVNLIELSLPSKPGETSLKKRSKENNKRDKSGSLLSSEVPQKGTGSSSLCQLGSQNSGHTQRSTSLLPAKTPSRSHQVEESRRSDCSTPKPASKSNSASLSSRPRPRRPVVIHDDIIELFTPDPVTYVVTPAHKTAKPKAEEGTIKSPTSEKKCSVRIVSRSSNAAAGSSCHKTQKLPVTGSPHAVDTKVSMPTVALKRVKLENLKPFSPKDSKLKKSPEVTSSGRHLKDRSVKSGEKQTSHLSNNVGPCTLETDIATSEQMSSSHRSHVLERQANEGRRKQVKEEDPIDVELDLGLSFELDLDLTHSSYSSEDEQLLSLQEMMERATKPPDTPEKGAFSEPSTPSCPSKTLPLPSNAKSGVYKNNLDQMLKEINTSKRAKEIETQLLTACKEDLLRIAEYEEAEENREEDISTEHQEFLQRYSLMSSAIREVPPGEVVFNLEKFGRIFNHNTLQLRQCLVNPQGTAQKTLLWSSPAQLRLHVNIGLFQEAYDSYSPCPTQVTRFLFKMMSIHNERMVSEKILQALCDIAYTAACQIVKHGSQKFKVWVPSLADVVLVLMNMGVAFVTLFPFENLQPPFTERDLLEDIYIKSESPSSNNEQSTFPEHNYSNILRYLSYCMALCPRAYSDDELLLLLTVVGRLGLDTRLILQSSVVLYPLQYKIVSNIRNWNTMLPRVCLALTDLTDDHHNMCLLVQMLPDHTRGKQLRRHLSLAMISKLLDGNCTYRPTGKEIQLSDLRPYLPRMQPSTLLRGMLSSPSRKNKEDVTALDQQSYYLCYSLLTLVNEASNFQFFPAHQKEQLLFLCSELETHVKCDIRESEKCLYRSKVKDLVARIYTKWQILLKRTRPLHDKLYDYWQPLPVDILSSSQEEQEMNGSDQGEEMEEQEEEDEDEGDVSETEENEVVMISGDAEKEEGDDTMDESRETRDNTKPDEMEGGNTVGDTNKTEKVDFVKECQSPAKDLLSVSAAVPEGEPEVLKESEVMEEQMEAENIACAEAETENLVETRETSQHDQVAAHDLVS